MELPSAFDSADAQTIASFTSLPTRLSISTSASIVSLAVFLLTTSDTRWAGDCHAGGRGFESHHSAKISKSINDLELLKPDLNSRALVVFWG